jgi:hypothetical protein
VPDLQVDGLLAELPHKPLIQDCSGIQKQRRFISVWAVFQVFVGEMGALMLSRPDAHRLAANRAGQQVAPVQRAQVGDLREPVAAQEHHIFLRFQVESFVHDLGLLLDENTCPGREAIVI